MNVHISLSRSLAHSLSVSLGREKLVEVGGPLVMAAGAALQIGNPHPCPSLSLSLSCPPPSSLPHLSPSLLSLSLSLYILYIYIYMLINDVLLFTVYRSTSLIRNDPLLGLCSRNMSRVIWWP